jgi:hypothetical protein
MSPTTSTRAFLVDYFDSTLASTDEPITSGLPVIRPQSPMNYPGYG